MSDVRERLILNLTYDADWKLQAECRGLSDLHRSYFFPEPILLHNRKRGRNKSSNERWRQNQAKKICQDCSVRQTCLDDALARREPDGIWGGLAWDERQRVLSAHKKQAAAS